MASDMKVINSLQGTVALHVSADDVTPRCGLLIRDLIELVGEAYQFSVKPQLLPGVPPAFLQQLIFQSGALIKDDGKLAIIQLAVLPNGNMVTATTTDIADLVMDDCIARLDSEMGYRFASAKKRRTYLSNIAVQFEVDADEKIEAIGKIENLLTKLILRPTMPFKFKRLAFGYGDVAQPGMISLEAVETSDFLIERRSSEPYTENRYFSAAPVRTSEHIELLEAIEQALERPPLKS
jgi:hypothetical protein